ncbi:FAD-binding oxidoreductase [Sulfuriferula nivalis]|uniref:FAD-linked oxidase n=1 Tax=Sulfuriferula nivalis TaxID=2675298 RepID=A0A809S7I0_9PROT|nr:FAD-binding oxidoreductase [Sulfuriferula nivalis]BBO99792.1 FAD-linked oxidase [Sulfuriferula nivalis]
MNKLNRPLSGWGRYPVETCASERPERYQDLRASSPTQIARGQGRSYGDAALGETVILTERVNRMLAFDVVAGTLRAEAGVTLAEILDVIVPQGWFLPVTPGTRFVSLGGCVAADVHGKNHHHDGAFGQHVIDIELILANNSRVTCSATENADLFWATVGGMGLTGIIGEVSLRLIPISSPYMQVRHHAAANLTATFALFENAALDDAYSVAWIDCLATGESLGRSVLMTGHHAAVVDLPNTLQSAVKIKPAKSMPFDLPAAALNPLTVKLFNQFYYTREGRKTQPFFAHYTDYFYPLDGISHWNRLYGKSGFVQYQCVIPTAGAFGAVTALLEKLAVSRRPSFLAVLKKLGAQDQGMLSFPLAGYTLALDIPMRDAGVLALTRELDAIVLAHGGRVYLAKDAVLNAQTFRIMYPRHAEWLRVKQLVDPHGRFASSLSKRLNLGAQHG